MRLLSKESEQALYDLYYRQHAMFGRDRLYKLAVSKGIDVSRREVLAWLKKQQINQLYAPTNRTVNIRNTVLSKQGVIGIDLIDMQHFADRGFHYILTGIDLFSKKAYAKALKNKEAKTVAAAMNTLITKDINRVSTVRSDNGSEFIAAEFQKVLKKHDVKHVFSLPSKPQSNGNIERFNGTLKRLLRMAMTATQSTDWPKLLENIISQYNNTVSQVTGKTPNDLDAEEGQSELLAVKAKIHKAVTSKRGTAETIKAQVGNKVRIKLDENDKDRLGENWSRQLYTVLKVKKPRTAVTAVAYTLALNGTPLKKVFYNNDILYVPAVENVQDVPAKYTISKIVRPVTHNKKPAFEVKWLHYPASENTIEPRDQLLEDAPKAIEQFEKKHNVHWLKTGKYTWDEKA